MSESAYTYESLLGPLPPFLNQPLLFSYSHNTNIDQAEERILRDTNVFNELCYFFPASTAVHVRESDVVKFIDAHLLLHTPDPHSTPLPDHV